MREALRSENLTKRFGSFEAVSDISFSISSGSITGLVGENGAGKSTLLGMLSGGQAPTSGSIHVRGENIDRLNPALARRLGIASVPQTAVLAHDLSVAENMMLGAEPSKFGWYQRTKANSVAAERLKRLDLDIDPRQLVGQLSPAGRQMVQIATSMGDEPGIVFLDEPTASLGPEETTALFRMVERLAVEGSSVLYVSHRLEEIFALCQHVLILRDGRLVASDKIENLDRDSMVSLMAGREYSQSVNSHHKISEAKPLLTAHALRLPSRLDDVSIEIRPGEIHGLGGMVGSGRSSLLAVIGGLCRPASGQMRLGGTIYEPHSPRDAIDNGIVLVPEDRRNEAALPEMTLSTNALIGRHDRYLRHGFVTKRREEVAATPLLTTVDVKPLRPRQPLSTLSGGNQQKVMIARALASEPQILLLDEPTQGVDVGTKADIHEMLRRLAASGAAVLVASSDLKELVEISDRVTVLSQGSVAATMIGPIEPEQVINAATTSHRSRGEVQ